MKISTFLSIWIYFFACLMILVSGFRGDVGSDTNVYRSYYESISFGGYDFLLSELNQFDYGFGFVIWFFTNLGLDFDSFNIIVSILSVVCLTFVYSKVQSRSFIVFCLIYLGFIYWQLQWSVIRQNVAFWILVVSIFHPRANYVYVAASSFFHKSSILFLVSYAEHLRFFKFLSYFLGGLVVLYFVFRYNQIDSSYILSFFGDGKRWMIGSIVYFLFHYAIYNKVRMSGKKIFFSALFVAFVFPIGWRVLAVFLPFMLTSDMRGMANIRFFSVVGFLFFMFAYKSYSHHLNMIESGHVSEIQFITSLVGGLL